LQAGSPGIGLHDETFNQALIPIAAHMINSAIDKADKRRGLLND